MSRLMTLGLSVAISQSVLAHRVVSQPQLNLIVPGARIGKMVLGPNGAVVLTKFGYPDIVDAGMSQTRDVWLGRGNSRSTLFIHTTANGAIDAKPLSGVTIDVIRTSSNRFHTASGISVGSTLAQVRRAYPLLHRARSENRSVLFCDRRQGIAFEFTKDKLNARCAGITVFAPGHSYLPTNHDISALIQSSPGHNKR
jgi:hypothetical protein